MSPEQWGQENPGVVEGGGFRVVCLKRAALGFEPRDLLLVDPAIEPEGGELVIDSRGRVARHGGGPVRGVIVGAIRRRVLRVANRQPAPAVRSLPGRPVFPMALLRMGSAPAQRQVSCGLGMEAPVPP